MTPEPRTLPRRTVLAASGTAVLAAAAACGSTPSTTDSSSSATSPAAGSAPTPASSAAGSSVAGASTAGASTASSAAANPSGTALATVADVKSAGSVVVDGPSGPVLLAAANGTVVAHTAICTHQGCTVAANGGCPCHGSKFNVQTGAVENPPALQPLAEVPVTVSGGQVFAT